MKIQINQIPSTYNYGSLMMAINIIKQFNRDYIEIYVDTLTEDDLQRLKYETGIKSIYKQEEYKDLEKHNKIVKDYKKSKRDAKIYDKVIFLGGDDISEYYSKGAAIRKLMRIYLLAGKIDTYLVGQTIGPFTSYRKTIAKIALNRTKIYTRDDKCLNYLKDLGVKTAIKGRDLAFSELPNKNNKGIVEKYNLEENKYITIVPSGLTKWYTNNIEDYYSQQVKIIENLLKKEELKDKKIILLPHVTFPKIVDDRNVIEELRNRINNNRIVYIFDEMLASEAREVLKNGFFTITGRMHAAVSTFYSKKPAISLSYSVKYSGVIGDGLDMNELVIESADDRLWSNGEISKLVDQKVNFVLDNYDELIQKIEVNVLKTCETVEIELKDFINEINK